MPHPDHFFTVDEESLTIHTTNNTFGIPHSGIMAHDKIGCRKVYAMTFADAEKLHEAIDMLTGIKAAHKDASAFLALLFPATSAT